MTKGNKEMCVDHSHNQSTSYRVNNVGPIVFDGGSLKLNLLQFGCNWMIWKLDTTTNVLIDVSVVDVVVERWHTEAFAGATETIL